jgi:glycosyltransferase involved in cell wall biosynthesis
LYYTTAKGVLQLSPSKGAKAIFIQNYEVPEGKTNLELDDSWRMSIHKILISQWLLDLARTKFHAQSVSHVPNSVDALQFHAPPRDKQKRPTVGLLYSKFSLKGVATSIKALRLLAEDFPDLRVVSFGSEKPDFRLPLPKFAEFHLRPPQSTLRALYAKCDLWLCGSNVEGFHLPPIEAMACRCPVVSTRVGGPLDIIKDGVNGYLVDTKDSAALADRMKEILQLSSTQWRQMSDAALATTTNYSWDDANLRFEQALQEAIDSSNATLRPATAEIPKAA